MCSVLYWALAILRACIKHNTVFLVAARYNTELPSSAYTQHRSKYKWNVPANDPICKRQKCISKRLRWPTKREGKHEIFRKYRSVRTERNCMSFEPGKQSPYLQKFVPKPTRHQYHPNHRSTTYIQSHASSDVLLRFCCCYCPGWLYICTRQKCTMSSWAVCVCVFARRIVLVRDGVRKYIASLKAPMCPIVAQIQHKYVYT